MADRTITLETLNGRGTLWHGAKAVVENATYNVVVTQRLHDTSSMSGASEVPGLKSVRGRISAEGHELFALMATAGSPELELELQDGRRWPCFLQSIDGTLAPRGGITDAPV
jgi:hypothetical protein